jgi:tRNA nucleotidyltransferase (CCA-adding enzyme)
MTEGSVSDVERLDFVTARTEFYQHPTALPEVEQSSIKQDLHRRDFTINTLAIKLNPAGFGDLLDFYGGYRDLKNKHIRVLHSLSFVEDPTRILRAIRLEQRLGFHLGLRTMEHLQNALDLLPRVSADRVFSELEYTLKEEKPEKAILRLDELGVLKVIHPNLKTTNQVTAQCQQLREGLNDTPWAKVKPDVGHYLGLFTFPLDPDTVSQLIERLRIRTTLERPLRQVQEIKQLAPSLSQAQRPSQVYHLLNLYKDDALLVCWLAFEDAAIKKWLAEFSQNLRSVQPIIDGKYLIENFGLRPSPLFGEILDHLRHARLDGKISTLAEEHILVEGLLQKN